MGKRDKHLDMNTDDLRAARVLTLAVKFFGASGPVSSSSIRADLYPDLDTRSFMRQYLRDRELLLSLGIVVKEVDPDGGDAWWQVDEDASYVTGDGLGATDALLLYVLCHDLTYDPSFVYRDELRIALAKIVQMYRPSMVARADTTTPHAHKLLFTLVTSMSNHHGVDVTYTDAKGHTSTRRLALLGSFGLRNHTYFVASRVGANGALEPDSTRTYRLDRFERARELESVSYEVPLDFAVADYERLPFQIGGDCKTARLALWGTSTDRALARAIDTNGTLSLEGGTRVWEVSYSDADDLAAWALANELHPLSPDKVCSAWDALLARSLQARFHDRSIISEPASSGTQERPQNVGRTGSVTVARQLVTLASSLTKEGKVITAHDISQIMGVSYDQARHLIALVSLGSGESIDYLPLVLGDQDDEVSLMEGARLSGRRVRLTRTETAALIAALSELGVDQDDQLVRTLVEAYASRSISQGDILRSIESPGSATDGATIKMCSQAILDGSALSFTYSPVSGVDKDERLVVPRNIRRSNDSWYLDAWDARRRANRVFRIDRMSDVLPSDISVHPASSDVREETRTVQLRFADRHYLDLFHWEGLQLVADDGEVVIASLPRYNGTWLARHLVACGGTVTTSDAALARQAHQYARDLSQTRWHETTAPQVP